MTKRPVPDQVKPRFRWRRWLLAGLLVCALGVAGSGWYLTRPARLIELSERLLTEYTGAEARVAGARFNWDGQVTLEGVSLRVPGLAGEAGELFEAEVVRVALDPARLLGGSVRVESVMVLRPTLHVTELGDTGMYNFQRLPGRGLDDDKDWLADLRLPAMSVTDATVRLGQWREDATLHVNDELRVAGQFMSSVMEPATYHFVVHQHLTGDEPGPRVHGTFDPAAQRVVAELDRFRFTGQQRGFLPTEFRQWWDRLDPAGTLPSVRVRYDPVTGIGAEMRVEDVAVNLPVRDLPARLSDVKGRFVFENQALRIEALTGRISEVRYHIDGVIEGFDREAPLNVTLRTDPFEVPDDAELAPLLPDPVLATYRRFNPGGRLEAQLHLERPRHGDALRYSGALELLGASGEYHRFAYPVHDMRGRVRFDNEQVVIDGIEGVGPNGGVVRVDGTVTPPGDGAALDLRIEGRDVPLDDRLLEAMEPSHRRVVDLFMNQEAYQRLVNAGVIRAPDADASSDDAPMFALGGTVSAQVHVQRPADPDASREFTVTLDGRGLGMMFAHWPYPLEIAGGSITVSRDHTSVDDVRVRGLTGAEGVISGAMSRESDAGLVPDLRLTQVRLPVDELLLATIPDPQDQWIREMRLDAVVDAEGRIFHDERGRTDFAVDFTLDDARMNPLRSGFALDSVNGMVSLQRDAVTLKGVSARRDDAGLHATGRVTWGEDDAGFALRFTGERMPIELSLLDMLPTDGVGRAQLAGLFEAYHPTGRFDAHLRIQSDAFGADALLAHRDDGSGGDVSDDVESPPGGGPYYMLMLEPRALAFNLRGRRIEIADMSGRAVVRRGAMRLTDVHGKFAHGEATVSGRFDLNEPIRAALTLNAQAQRLDGDVRALLPVNVVRVLDHLEVDGAFGLEGGRLRWRPEAVDATRFAFDGSISLANVALQIGLPVSDLHGSLDVQYADRADRLHPHADLDFQLRRLRIADRHIAPARLTLGAVDEGGEQGGWAIRALHGQMYDGVVTGDGYLMLDGEGGYQLDLAMQNVRLSPLIDPNLWPESRVQVAERTDAKHDESQDDDVARRPDIAYMIDDAGRPIMDNGSPDAVDLSRLPPGKVDASLTLEGAYGDVHQRRGRGQIRVREAELFDRPLDMAMLQAVSLALPLAGGFEHADIDYLVDGETVHLESIRMESPTLVVVGAGTMDVSTQGLDLTLFVRNPAGEAFGPLSEMIHAIRDELMCIKVNGTLNTPQARVVSLDGVRDAWRRMFE